MALKSRFAAKSVEIKKIEDKENKIKSDSPTLQLIKNSEELEKAPLEGDKNHLLKKINCYHKISELYQDDNLSLFALMKGLLDIVCSGVDACGGSLWIFSDTDNTLTCKVATGIGSKGVEGVNLPLGKGIVGWVGEKKQSTIVYDAESDERFSNKIDTKNSINTKSLMASPLVYNKELIGVIEVINKKSSDGKFTDSDRFFLDDLATPAAMHIKNSRVLKDQENIVKRLKTFSELHEKFNSTIDLEPLLQIVLLKAIEILRAEVGSLWMLEEGGEGVVCSIAEGPTKDKVMGLKLKKGVGIIGWVVDSNAPIIVEDCSKDSRFSKAMDKKINFETKTMISVPLSVKGECLGAIQIINKQGKEKFFNHDDLDLLMLFASSSSMYIKNAKLFATEKKAKELSALISISKEITSTLDLDSVLLSIVNLSSQIIPYDRAGISVKAKGQSDKYSLSATSGEKIIEKNNEKNIDLGNIHNLIIKSEKKNLSINNLDSEIAKINAAEEGKEGKEAKERNSDGETQGHLISYMEKYKLKSFWANILEDDQGVLGIISMEATEANMLQVNKQELLTILISQSTVALRNAELYNTIPSSQVFRNVQENFWQNLKNLKNVPLHKLLSGVASIVAFVLCFIYIKLPHYVDANVEIKPYSNIFYSNSKGTIKSIKVKEGQIVKKGTLLVELDVSEHLMELRQKQYLRQKAMSEMLKSRSEGKIADYKIKESELLSLDYEIKLLLNKIRLSKIFSSMDGIVISEKLDDLIGMPVNFGQELIKVASLDYLYVQFEVLEEDIRYVKNNQDVKFKVYGHPTKSFSDGIKLETVSGEGVQILESDPTKYYLAKAKVKKTIDQFSILKPGMTGRGKIYSEWKPVWQTFFSRIINFLIMEVIF